MLLFTDAVKIATEKVIQSILNIFIFRNIYSATRIWLSGFYAFFLTIYISSKLRALGVKIFRQAKNLLFPDLKKYDIEFDKANLESINLAEPNQEQVQLIDEFIKKNKENAQIDLFSCIFGSSSQSSLLNLFIFVAIEYLNDKYFENLLVSCLFCISIAFILCFGSSFRYSQIITQEWSDWLEELDSAKLALANSKKS